MPLLRTVNVIEAEGAFMMLKEEKSKMEPSYSTFNSSESYSTGDRDIPSSKMKDEFLPEMFDTQSSIKSRRFSTETNITSK